ncbi:hypothetical protein HAP94_10060 [Acidithiobacillus ferrivorans]|nr:hypothetical protein [Acidithiobacillus ferrivorans]
MNDSDRMDIIDRQIPDAIEMRRDIIRRLNADPTNIELNKEWLASLERLDELQHMAEEPSV